MDEACRAARRFPFVLVVGALAAAAAIIMVEPGGERDLIERVLVAATLGLPLFIALKVAGEQSRHRGRSELLLTALGLATLTALAARWTRWSEPVQLGRYVQLSVAFHLLVAVAPVRRGSERAAFWEYNSRLFERFLLTTLYSVVLFAGLALALLALDKLFDVDLPRAAYARLWCVIAFVFHTWFFVAGVPRDVGALAGARQYPRGLKAFTQYVLIPLVALYLVLLTAYLAKVLVTWEWPSGWIGWLVSSVAVVGTLALLLVHPVAGEAGDRWVTTYARGFYLALLPAIVMLWLAIWQRVGQYGVTERRYFLIVLSVWLTLIAVQQLVTRSRDIRVIPASLAAVALLTVAGPWGAYRVSERSQVGRLARLLERHGALVEGRARPTAVDVPADDRREISAALRYLADTHGFAAIAPWFGGRDALALVDTLGRAGGPSRVYGGAERARLVAVWLGVPYVPGAGGPRDQWFAYRADPFDGTLPVSGFDSLVFVEAGGGPALGTGLVARAVYGGRLVEVLQDGEPVATIPLDSLLAALRLETAEPPQADPWPASRLRIDREAGDRRYTLLIREMSGSWQEDSIDLRSFTGVLLVGRR
jgi:hypothetical protein